MGVLDTDRLASLCRPPHVPLSLTEIDLRGAMLEEDELMELVRLPSLTALEPTKLRASACVLLPRFLRLQRLRLHLDSGDVAELDSIAESLRLCQSLRHLVLTGSATDAAGCALLLAATPQLRALTLDSVPAPSLAFLRHAPQLHSLRLSDCTSVRTSHLMVVGSMLPALQRLDLIRSARLDALELSLLRPPAALLMPALHHFFYEPA